MSRAASAEVFREACAKFASGVAVALKRAGAAIVTVLPICLLLNPAWGANATFSQSPHRRLWSPDICPVTGSGCP